MKEVKTEHSNMIYYAVSILSLTRKRGVSRRSDFKTSSQIYKAINDYRREIPSIVHHVNVDDRGFFTDSGQHEVTDENTDVFWVSLTSSGVSLPAFCDVVHAWAKGYNFNATACREFNVCSFSPIRIERRAHHIVS